MKRLIAGVLIASLLSPLAANAFPVDSAVVGAGAAYATGSYLAIPAAGGLVVSGTGAAVSGVAAGTLVPPALAASNPGITASLVSQGLLTSTPTIIVSAAAGMVAYILYEALTGRLHPPKVTLVQEGYSKPSGKAYRYQVRK
jgi:hypothetical protein